MTFEEFKSDWEKWNPIKTDQDLEICIDKYKNHHQIIEDNDYLEPIERLNDVIFSGNYLQQLNSLFKFEEIENDEIIFLVLPSFAPEYLLRMSDSQIDLFWLSEDLWANYYSKSYHKVEIKSKLLNLPIDEIKFIRREIKNNLQNAKSPQVKTVVLDGIQYFFLHKTNEGINIGFKHSPLESSKIGRLISYINKKIIPVIF